MHVASVLYSEFHKELNPPRRAISRNLDSLRLCLWWCWCALGMERSLQTQERSVSHLSQLATVCLQVAPNWLPSSCPNQPVLGSFPPHDAEWPLSLESWKSHSRKTCNEDCLYSVADKLVDGWDWNKMLYKHAWKNTHNCSVPFLHAVRVEILNKYGRIYCFVNTRFYDEEHISSRLDSSFVYQGLPWWSVSSIFDFRYLRLHSSHDCLRLSWQHLLLGG